MIKIEDTQTQPVIAVEEVSTPVVVQQETTAIVVEPVHKTTVVYRNDAPLTEYISTLAIIACLIIVFGRSISVIGALAGGLLVTATAMVGLFYLFLQAVL